MVGPSSSHTAGACKIGQFARALFHHTPEKVTFYLHGSFGEVYKGHATDRALLAGVMKFQTSDPRIKESFDIADEAGLKYQFIPKDLGSHCHPNTVEIILEKGKEKMSVIGCSIGGGMIEIKKIDNFDIFLKGTAGKRLSIVVGHDDKKGVIQNVIKEMTKDGTVEVAEAVHSKYLEKMITVLGIEGRRVTVADLLGLEKLPGVDFVRSLCKLQKQ